MGSCNGTPRPLRLAPRLIDPSPAPLGGGLIGVLVLGRGWLAGLRDGFSLGLDDLSADPLALMAPQVLCHAGVFSVLLTTAGSCLGRARRLCSGPVL